MERNSSYIPRKESVSISPCIVHFSLELVNVSDNSHNCTNGKRGGKVQLEDTSSQPVLSQIDKGCVIHSDRNLYGKRGQRKPSRSLRGYEVTILAMGALDCLCVYVFVIPSLKWAISLMVAVVTVWSTIANGFHQVPPYWTGMSRCKIIADIFCAVLLAIAAIIKLQSNSPSASTELIVSNITEGTLPVLVVRRLYSMFRFELVFKSGRILLWACMHGVYYRLTEYFIARMKQARGCLPRSFWICIYFSSKVFSMPLIVYLCLSVYEVQITPDADIVVQLAMFLIISLSSVILTTGCIAYIMWSARRPLSFYMWLCLLKLVFVLGLTVAGSTETAYILHFINVNNNNVIRYKLRVLASVIRNFSLIMVLVVENMTSVYLVLLFYSPVFRVSAHRRPYKIVFILSALCAMVVTIHSGVMHASTDTFIRESLLLSYSVPFVCTTGTAASAVLVQIVYCMVVMTTVSSIVTALLIMAYRACTITIIRIITVLMSFGPSWLLMFFPRSQNDAIAFYFSVLSVIHLGIIGSRVSLQIGYQLWRATPIKGGRILSAL
jgi:hypothetical protein